MIQTPERKGQNPERKDGRKGQNPDHPGQNPKRPGQSPERPGQSPERKGQNRGLATDKCSNLQRKGDNHVNFNTNILGGKGLHGEKKG